eukprot:1342148-Alexandrium_andersonii.AAC.1
MENHRARCNSTAARMLDINAPRAIETCNVLADSTVYEAVVSITWPQQQRLRSRQIARAGHRRRAHFHAGDGRHCPLFLWIRC